MANYPISYLGRAPQFPFVVDANGRFVLIQDEELIKQALVEQLSENIGTRFMIGEYGSKIKSLLFEKNTEVLHSLLSTFILEALRPEQRVKIRKIDISSDIEKVSVTIRYTIVQSNTIDTLFYELNLNAG